MNSPSLSVGLMRAAVYDHTASEGVRIVSKQLPKLPSNHALVRVISAGCNPVDSKKIIGDKLPGWCSGIVDCVVSGSTPGFDFSGVVVDVALPAYSEQAAPGFSQGDHVFGILPPFTGSFAEMVAAPVSQLCKKPAFLTFAEAAAIPLVGVTCLQAFEQHGLLVNPVGKRLLVIGASGGVGHVAVQVAAMSGVSVVGVCSEKNRLFVEHLGADAVIAYDKAVPRHKPPASTVTDHVVEDLRSECAHAGKPFDMVFDTVTSHDPRDRSFNYEGRILAATFRKHSLVEGLFEEPLLPLVHEQSGNTRNYVMIGSTTPGWLRAGIKSMTGWNVFAKKNCDLFWITPAQAGPHLDALKRLCDNESGDDDDKNDVSCTKKKQRGQMQKKLRPAIAMQVPFTDEGLRDAFRAMRGRRTVGKVIINVSADE